MHGRVNIHILNVNDEFFQFECNFVFLSLDEILHAQLSAFWSIKLIHYPVKIRRVQNRSGENMRNYARLRRESFTAFTRSVRTWAR